MRFPAWASDALKFTATIVAVFAISILVVYAGKACGQDVTCAPEVATRRAELPYQGAPGIWFDVRVARCMVADLATLPLLNTRVHLLDEQLEIRSEQVEALREAVHAATEAEQRLDAVLVQAELNAAQAREALHAWYRSPFLWFAVGAATVLAVGITTLLLAH